MPEPTPTFRRPATAWFVILDGGVLALTVLAADRRAYDAAAARVPLPSRRTLQGLLWATAAVHAAEALAAGRLARRRGLPAGRWAAQTFLVGFPSLLALRRVTEDLPTGRTLP